jgi:hypothetical protein
MYAVALGAAAREHPIISATRTLMAEINRTVRNVFGRTRRLGSS